MSDMVEVIAKIKAKVEALGWHPGPDTPTDDIQFDRDLGEIECLIHEARAIIDSMWRDARPPSSAVKITGVDALDLLSDL